MTVTAQARTFFGRERELEELRGAVAAAREGRGRCFLVSGEPGIGKTRLADEIAVLGQRDGFATAWGRCWEGGGTPAFWPWAQALRRLARGSATGRTVAAWEPVAALMSEGAPGAARSAPPPAERSRLRLFEAVASLIETLAAEQPLLLIFDDMHAADVDSLQLLRFVSRELGAMHALTVVTYRESEVTRVRDLSMHFADLARDSETIALRGISADATAEFVLATLEVGGAPIARGDVLLRLAHQLHEITEGNPFFLQQIVRELLAGDPESLRSGGESLERLQLPAHVRNAIRRRLAPLPPETVELLAIAAVVGREFDRRILERVPSVVPSSACGSQLEEAERAGVIQPLPDGALQFRFTHALIRETLYEDLPAPRRAELHHAVGQVIEEIHSGNGSPPIPALVHHFLRAVPDGTRDRLVKYTRAAAQQATAVFAYDEAISHWRRALAALDTGPLDGARDPLRCELLLGLGEALNTAAKRRERVEVFREAAAMARKLGAPDLLARAALGSGGDWQGMSEVPKSDSSPGAVLDDGLAKMLREALDARGDARDALHARLSSRLAVETYFSSPLEERERLTAEALQIARELDDPVTLANVLSETHVALWGPHNVSERYGMSREIVRLAQQTGLLGLEAGGRAYCVSNALELADREVLHVEVAAFRKLAEQSKLPHLIWVVKVYDTLEALMTGRFGDAEKLAFETLSYGLEAQRPAAISFGLQLTALRREQDRLSEVTETLGMVKSGAEHFPALRHLRASLASLYCDLGRVDEGRENLLLALPETACDLPSNLTWLSATTDLAEACIALDDRERAAGLYDALAPYQQRFIVSPFCSTCAGSVARPLGSLATMLGRWSDAEEQFELALERNRSFDAHPWVGHTQLAYARLLFLRARQSQGTSSRLEARAIELLRDARACARDLGMPRLERLVATLAADERHDLDAPLAPTAAVASAAPASTVASAELAGNLFRRLGNFWTVRYAGKSVQLKNARGLEYLSQLLRSPGHDFGALELVGSPELVEGTNGSSFSGEALGDAGPHLDPAAKAAYRQRLASLREELEEAETFHDEGRSERLREEIDRLTTELSRALGLGGRDRRASSNAERARISVTRAITRALKSIAQCHPPLGEHLDATIRTGTFCCYRPDPGRPIAWET